MTYQRIGTGTYLVQGFLIVVVKTHNTLSESHFIKISLLDQDWDPAQALLHQCCGPRSGRIRNSCTRSRSDLIENKIFKIFANLSSQWSNLSLYTFALIFPSKILAMVKSLAAVPLCTVKIC